MGSIERKVRRNQLKALMNTNKISKEWEKEQMLRYGTDYKKQGIKNDYGRNIF